MMIRLGALVVVAGFGLNALSVSSVFAADINAASCSQPDVQGAVDSSGDGDRVNIPAGQCTWSAPVVWSDKNIHVRGAGIDRTVISRNAGHAFYVAANNKGQFRISDMTFTGSLEGGNVVTVTTEGSRTIVSGWRLDHMKFDFASGQRIGISIRGVTYGVVDHNYFNWSQGLAILVAAFNANDECTVQNPMGNFINSQPLDLGTANAVYIEDNGFTSTGNGGIPVYDTSSGGGRTVFRYNTVIGGFYYAHWTRGCEIGGIVHEIYNNVWTGNSDYRAYFARLEAGTGVVFNNTVQNFDGSTGPYIYLDDRRALTGGENSGLFGSCDGTKPWDGDLADPAAPGWPCLGQIGRAPGKSAAAIISGDKQVSAPLYLWNNGVDSGCATGGACIDKLGVWATPSAYVKPTPHPNGDVDYVLNGSKPKPGYVPFAYPHPLVSGITTTNPAPLPPTNVRVVLQ